MVDECNVLDVLEIALNVGWFIESYNVTPKKLALFTHNGRHNERTFGAN